MKLENLIIGVALWSVVMLLGGQFLLDTIGFYHVTDTSGSDKFAKMPDYSATTLNLTDDMKNKISGETVTSDSAIDNMYAGATKSVRTNPYTAASSGTIGLTAFFEQSPIKLPPAVLLFLSSILITLTVTAILYLWFRVVQ